jgi:arginase family enzyme
MTDNLPVLASVSGGWRSISLTRAWLHVDLDVLDRSAMPAVDSPGTPGLTFAQLRT